MAMNGNDLGDAVIDVINTSGLSASELSDLQNQWRSIGNAIVNYITQNAELDGAKLENSLNTIFTGGVPAPTDGGAALQTAWSLSTSAGAKDSVIGGIK